MIPPILPYHVPDLPGHQAVENLDDFTVEPCLEDREMVRHYTDHAGVKRIQGGRDLKCSQRYPDGFPINHLAMCFLVFVYICLVRSQEKNQNQIFIQTHQLSLKVFEGVHPCRPLEFFLKKNFFVLVLICQTEIWSGFIKMPIEVWEEAQTDCS